MTIGAVIRKYFHFAARDKLRYAVVMLFVLITAAIGILLPLVYGSVIDEVRQGHFYDVVPWLLALLGILMADVFLNQLKFIIGDVILIRDLFRQSRLEYISALHNADYVYHVNKSSGGLIALAKRGEGALFTAFWEVNGNGLKLLVEFVFATIVLFSISPALGLAMGLVVVVSIFLGALIIRVNIAKRKLANAQDDVITGLTVDNLVGFETVKIFAGEEWERKRFEKAYVPWMKSQFDYIETFRWLDITLGLVKIAGFLAIFVLGIELVTRGEISLGVFVAAIVYILSISGQLSNFIYKIRELGKTFADLVKYFEVMDIKPVIVSPTNPLELSAQDAGGEISFEKVSFVYPSSGQKVFSGLDLIIKPRERLALVGTSGAGKTTLTKLLMRFYDPDGGEIKINSKNINSFSLSSLRRAIGLVPQDVILFNDSLRQNLIYGNQDASQLAIEQALKQSNLWEFTTSLPEGLDTVVGERGIKLSGGQRQRLAIARVLIENPPIIIFDEATSQLDSENEVQIQQAFENLAKGRTTITIAHRLSTIMRSDRIVVFRDGDILEQGTHDELLKNSKEYSKLWDIQTKNIS